nr:hypothetical protein OG999_02780 [Streptomyces sp. NBC_00886]
MPKYGNDRTFRTPSVGRTTSSTRSSSQGEFVGDGTRVAVHLDAEQRHGLSAHGHRVGPADHLNCLGIQQALEPLPGCRRGQADLRSEVGVLLLTPFPSMALMCPDTTEQDVDTRTRVFAQALAELAQLRVSGRFGLGAGARGRGREAVLAAGAEAAHRPGRRVDVDALLTYPGRRPGGVDPHPRA